MLVLDFDGVICDSVDECFDVANALFPRPGALMHGATDANLLQTFRRYRHWLSDGFHYPALLYLLSIDALGGVSTQEEFDTVLLRHADDILSLFGVDDWSGLEGVYQNRRRDTVQQDPTAWLARNPLYDVVAAALKAAEDRWDRFYIATSKPTAFAEKILWHHGIVLPEDQIIGKDKVSEPVAKNGHLQLIANISGTDYAAMHFVDDQVSHLTAAAPLGVRRYIAAWGYNDSAQQEIARQDQITVLHRDAVPETFARALA